MFLSLVCLGPIYYIIVFIQVNWIGRVCVALHLTRVSWKKLLRPKIYTCEFVTIL